MISPYLRVDFACVKEDLYEAVSDQTGVPLLPMKLYLSRLWLNA